LDEPLSALDLEIRQRLQEYVLNIHRQFGTTIVLISHDLGEVFKLADRVLVMHRGEVIKEGTPEQVFLLPQEDKDFSISGVLLSKSAESEEFCRITVQVQSQMFSFTVVKELVTGVEVGNLIQLSGGLSELSIHQIKPPIGIEITEIKP
jgi:molybdate transport system ATP-binding protein